jgi:hypothetical protein
VKRASQKAEGGKMRRLFTTIVAVALVAALAASPVLAKTHSFTLNQDSKINGVSLDAGKYKLELNGDTEAHIYKGRELVAKAPVNVKDLSNGSTRASVLCDAEGNVLEIRLKDQVVVFAR